VAGSPEARRSSSSGPTQGVQRFTEGRSMTDKTPPYDRALALASFVKTLRVHYLAVRCGCGAGRVIGLEPMARDKRYADLTLAHVALRLACSGCQEGPDEVWLCDTPHGLNAPSGYPGSIWTLPLVQRSGRGARRLRFVPNVANNPMVGELLGEHGVHGGTKPPPEGG
jgi:hypothetical protein